MPDEETLTVKAARAYSTRGLAVFPLDGKIPVTDNGVHDASVDLEATIVQTRRRKDGTVKSSRSLRIIDWLAETTNLGIAVPPNVVVVDIDPRNGGHDTFNDWLDSYPELGIAFDTAPCAETGGGGWHYWFQYDGRALVKEIGGVDFCRVGKYVVAPPSKTNEHYRWITKLPAELAELPTLPPVLEALATPKAIPPTTKWPGVADRGDALAAAAQRYTSWYALLTRHGWTPTDSSATKWRHPSSENQFSATLTNDCLFVYSPNTQFEVTESGDPHGVTLFRAISTLDFNGDDRATAADFRSRGLLPEAPDPIALDSRMQRAGGQLVERAQRGERAGHVATNRLDSDHEPRLRLRTIDGVEMRRVRWLWKNRIPTGALTLLAGREGEGKSTIAIDSIARTTRGTSRGEFEGTPRDALIVATEDSYEHTIMPRLVAAGADLARVFTIEMIEPGDSLSLPVDIAELERACDAHDVALVVLDPLLSRLDGRLDSHKDGDVRRALEPLGAFADRVGCSILGLIHLNKGGSADPLQAIMASRAFTAFARAVLFAMIDPDNENRRLLGLVKSNLGPLDLPTLTYTFEPIEVGYDDGPIVATRVKWGEDSPTRIGDALVNAGVEAGPLHEACEWLRDYLDFEGGSAPAALVLTAGKKEHHAERTLRRAREKLGMISERTRSVPPTVVWRWPSEHEKASS